MTDRNPQGWGPPHPPSSGGIRRLGVGVVGVLAGWAIAYGFGRLTYLLGGEAIWGVAVSSTVLLACVIAGPMVAVRRYDLRHKRR
jgi:hypothetical protein